MKKRNIQRYSVLLRSHSTTDNCFTALFPHRTGGRNKKCFNTLTHLSPLSNTFLYLILDNVNYICKGLIYKIFLHSTSKGKLTLSTHKNHKNWHLIVSMQKNMITCKTCHKCKKQPYLDILGNLWPLFH